MQNFSKISASRVFKYGTTLAGGGIHALALTILSVISSAAQSQTNTIGSWQNKAGVFSGIKAYTDSALGVGTPSPGGKAEISWCVPPQLPQPGLLITRLNCFWNQTGTGIHGGFNDVIDIGGLSGGGESDPNLNNPPATPLTPSHAYVNNVPFGFQLRSINHDLDPLIYARIQTPSPAPDAGDDARFLVFPDGRTGINVANPRCALDVRGFGPNAPVAIFGVNAQRAPVSITTSPLQHRFTKHIEIVPHLAAGGYNRISQEKDLGIIFTDGLGSNGSNQSGALVIAPWRESSIPMGLRIDSSGNVAIGSSSSFGYKLAVNGGLLVKDELLISSIAYPWPDYVFKNYALKGTNEVYSIQFMEQFIRSNGHLPEIPSGSEVESNGIKTSKMFCDIVRQMEIMALQIIELKDIVKYQENRINELLKEKE